MTNTSHKRKCCKKHYKKQCDKHEFDVIFVGGGTAGSAAVYKLNKLRPEIKILVIESGQDDQALAQTGIPGLTKPGAQDEFYPGTPLGPQPHDLWVSYMTGGFFSLPPSSTNGLHCFRLNEQMREDCAPFPTMSTNHTIIGSTWGGSSAHNSTMWLRPTKFYFDEIEKVHNIKNWTWEDSVKNFKEIEHRTQIGRFQDGGVIQPEPWFDPAKGPVLDSGFDPLLMGDNGNIAVSGNSYIDPATFTYYKAHEQFNAITPSNYGIGVTDLSPDFEEIVCLAPKTNILNSTATPSDLDLIGGPERISLNSGSNIPSFWTRVTAGNTFLVEASNQENVTVWSNTFVTKVLLDKCKRVKGVEYLEGRNIFRTGRNNQADYQASDLANVSTKLEACKNADEALKYPKKVFCNKEVILCAGAHLTPCILEHSGIGDSNYLMSLGIKSHVNLPGVGENLSDHVSSTQKFYGTRGNIFQYLFAGLEPYFISNTFTKVDPCRKGHDMLNIRNFGNGSQTRSNCDNRARITRFQDNAWTLQDSELTSPPTNVEGPTMANQICYPKSRGSVHIQSKDPTQPPKTILNFYKEREDLEQQYENWIRNIEIFELTRNENYIEGNPAPPFENVISVDPADAYFQGYREPTYGEMTDDFFEYIGTVSNISPDGKVYTLAFNDPEIAGNSPCLLNNLSRSFLEMTSGDAVGQKRYIHTSITDTATILAPFYGTGLFPIGGPFPEGQTGPVKVGDEFGIRRIDPGKCKQKMVLTAKTVWHTCGTCKMGTKIDPTAVVDERLRVHKTKGLRVADNSIWPVVTDTNTQTGAYLVGWKCAKFLSEDL